MPYNYTNAFSPNRFDYNRFNKLVPPYEPPNDPLVSGANRNLPINDFGYNQPISTTPEPTAPTTQFNEAATKTPPFDFAAEYAKINQDRPNRLAYQKAIEQGSPEINRSNWARLGAVIAAAGTGLNEGATAGYNLGMSSYQQPQRRADEAYERKIKGLERLAGYEDSDKATQLELAKLKRDDQYRQTDLEFKRQEQNRLLRQEFRADKLTNAQIAQMQKSMDKMDLETVDDVDGNRYIVNTVTGKKTAIGKTNMTTKEQTDQYIERELRRVRALEPFEIAKEMREHGYNKEITGMNIAGKENVANINKQGKIEAANAKNQAVLKALKPNEQAAQVWTTLMKEFASDPELAGESLEDYATVTVGPNGNHMITTLPERAIGPITIGDSVTTAGIKAKIRSIIDRTIPATSGNTTNAAPKTATETPATAAPAANKLPENPDGTVTVIGPDGQPKNVAKKDVEKLLADKIVTLPPTNSTSSVAAPATTPKPAPPKPPEPPVDYSSITGDSVVRSMAPAATPRMPDLYKSDLTGRFGGDVPLPPPSPPNYPIPTGGRLALPPTNEAPLNPPPPPPRMGNTGAMGPGQFASMGNTGRFTPPVSPVAPPLIPPPNMSMSMNVAGRGGNPIPLAPQQPMSLDRVLPPNTMAATPPANVRPPMNISETALPPNTSMNMPMGRSLPFAPPNRPSPNPITLGGRGPINVGPAIRPAPVTATPTVKPATAPVRKSAPASFDSRGPSSQIEEAKGETEFNNKFKSISDRVEEITGYRLKVVEGKRSASRQAQIASDAKAKGQWKTDADGTKVISKHQTGEAADIQFVDERGRPISGILDNKGRPTKKGEDLYRTFGRIAKEHGLTWGGDWEERDWGHIQLGKELKRNRP